MCVCVCQAHVEELPAKEEAMKDLNARHKQIVLPAERQKDIRIINTRWAQVGVAHPVIEIRKKVKKKKM